MSAALLLAACGGGTSESPFQPTRIVSFGDAFSDVGQRGTRYTVNDGTVNVWTQQLAVSFGVDLRPSSAGGASYATGSAFVSRTPDLAWDYATPPTSRQIDSFLAQNTIGAKDLIVVNGGISDVIAEEALLLMPARGVSYTPDQALAGVRQAGRDLAAQVRRLVAAGARHVVVVGTYDLSRSLWKFDFPPQKPDSAHRDRLSRFSIAFNDELRMNIADLGHSVLYVDAALFYDAMTLAPATYGMSNATEIVCTSIDVDTQRMGLLGLGGNQVASPLCTPATVITGVDYNQYVFADAVYPTPAAHRRFGTYAYEQIRMRW